MIPLLVSLMALGSPVHIDNPNLSDLEFLKREITSRRIVELGEATHGGAEFYRLKLRLVRFLHEKCGFQVLAIESGIMETGLAGLNRSQISERDLLLTSMSGGMRWREMLPVLAYVRSKPNLKLIGFDPQFSATEVLDYVHDVIAPYRPKLAAQIRMKLGEPYQYMGKASEPEVFRRSRDAYLTWLRDLEGHVDSIRPKAGDVPKFAILREGIAALSAYWNFEPDTAMVDRYAKRDQLMAKHLLSQVGKEKVIVWAHNGHLGRGIGYRVMGDHLRETRKDVFGIGLFARTGDFRQHWSEQVHPWEPSTTGVEGAQTSKGEATYYPSRALVTTTTAFEPENGGLVTFIPSQRFDGLLVVDRLTPTHRP